jgi:hypothetical protein
MSKGRCALNFKKHVLVMVVAVVSLFGVASPSAYGLHFWHKSNTPHIEKAKKNNSPYAYLKSKKQKKAKGYYRSTLTGQMVYGKPRK